MMMMMMMMMSSYLLEVLYTILLQASGARCECTRVVIVNTSLSSIRGSGFATTAATGDTIAPVSMQERGNMRTDLRPDFVDVD
jgi:hypothetical protein